MNIRQSSPNEYRSDDSPPRGFSGVQENFDRDIHLLDANSSLIFGNDFETQKDAEVPTFDSLHPSTSMLNSHPLSESDIIDSGDSSPAIGDTQVINVNNDAFNATDPSRTDLSKPSSSSGTAVGDDTEIARDFFVSQLMQRLDPNNLSQSQANDTQLDTQIHQNQHSEPDNSLLFPISEPEPQTEAQIANGMHNIEDTQIVEQPESVHLIDDIQQTGDTQLVGDIQPIIPVEGRVSRVIEDTQIIADTQIIEHSQAIKDTQVIENIPHTKLHKQNGRSQSHTLTGIQELDDTQPIVYGEDTLHKSKIFPTKLPRDFQSDQGETQQIAVPIQETIDANFRQFTSVLVEEDDNKSPSVTQTNVPLSSPNLANADTVAGHMLSHTQVVNTQELPIKGNYQGLNYSPGRDTADVEEVQTEDEDEKVISELPEDSLISTRLKRKLDSTNDDKVTKLSHQNTSKSLSINNSNAATAPSPTEIRTSSPFVKNLDILNVLSDSSPTKDSSDIFIVSESVKLRRKDLRPPSSPEVIELEGSKTPTDLHTKTSINSMEPVKQSSHIAARRRKNYIVESQEDSGVASSGNRPVVFRSEVLEILCENDVRFRDSVWVSYNLNMYTGSLIEKGQESLTIEFDEGQFSIKNSDIFLLDIRIGDTICIKNSTAKYRVTGLSFADSQNQIRCIRGYNVVHLQRFTKTKEFSEISVPLCECYMDISDWIMHQHNFKLIYGEQDLLKDQLETPFRNATPLSVINERSIRGVPFSSPVRSANLKKLSVDTSGRIFSQKLFFITSIEGERKEEIVELIKTNGGTIINEDPYLLFTYGDDDSHIQLNVDLTGVMFGAMISNSHCRSAKYLQALALGWPILSDMFIVDCINGQSKFDQWPVYLLPAGQSKYLQSIKSLDVYQFRQNYEKRLELNRQIDLNCRLLEDYDIIVLNNKKNSDTIETCKFIFCSFGVRSLRYRSKYSEVLSDIKKLTKQSGNLLVFDESGTVSAKLQNQQPSTRKTRSQYGNKKTKEPLTMTKGQTIGIINWEWVVQCVISSCVWKPQLVPV